MTLPTGTYDTPYENKSRQKPTLNTLIRITIGWLFDWMIEYNCMAGVMVRFWWKPSFKDSTRSEAPKELIIMHMFYSNITDGNYYYYQLDPLGWKYQYQ